MGPNQSQPLVPGEMPDVQQFVLLTELFEVAMVNSAFVRWERYRDTQIAQGRTWQSFLYWMNIRLIDGLTVYEEKLTALEAELAKDEKLKL